MSLRRTLLATLWCAALPLAATAEPLVMRVQRPLTEPNGWSEAPAISADGRSIVFSTLATNISHPAGTGASLMAFDVGTGHIVPLTAGENGRSTWASVSSTGRYVAFETTSTNIGSGGADGDGTDVMRLDRQTGAITRVSATSSGIAADGPAQRPAISGDGRYVVFASYASNLLAADIGDGLVHLYERDLQTGTTRMADATAAAAGDGDADQLEANALSADGSRLVFTTAAENLASVFDGNVSDVLVRTRHPQTGAISFQNVNRSAGGAVGTSSSSRGSISPNGRYVVFRSAATELLPNPSLSGLYVRDLDTNTVHGVALPVGYHACDRARVTNQGDVLMQCSPLAPATAIQLFVAALGQNAPRLVSRNIIGWAANLSSDNAFTISANGELVAFESEATNLIASDTNGAPDVFVAAEAAVLYRLFANGFE